MAGSWEGALLAVAFIAAEQRWAPPHSDVRKALVLARLYPGSGGHAGGAVRVLCGPRWQIPTGPRPLQLLLQSCSLAAALQVGGLGRGVQGDIRKRKLGLKAIGCAPLLKGRKERRRQGRKMPTFTKQATSRARSGVLSCRCLRRKGREFPLTNECEALCIFSEP